MPSALVAAGGVAWMTGLVCGLVRLNVYGEPYDERASGVLLAAAYLGVIGGSCLVLAGLATAAFRLARRRHA